MSLHKNVLLALPYAQALAAEGIRLALPANSDFVPLVRSASPYGGLVHGETKENFLSRIDQNGQVDNFNMYEEISGSLKTELVDLVRSHIRNAQEVAKLVIDGIVRVKGYLDQQPDTSATGRFAIIEDPLCDVVEDDHFQSLLNNVPAMLSELRNPNLVQRPRSEEQIMAMLVKEGVDTKAIIQALSFFAVDENGAPRNVLEEIYRGLFCGDRSVSRNYSFRDIGKIPAGERAVVAYIGYLIAISLRIEVPEDANGSLNEFTKDASDYQVFLHRTLIGAFNEKKSQIESGQLILDPYYSDNVLIVEKSVYGAFLESGGSPEMVLGVKVGSLPYYMASEVSSNAKTIVESWNTFARLNTATSDNERQTFLRAIYKAVWDQLGENILEFEKDMRQTDKSLFGKMTIEAYKWLDSQKLDSLKDVECTMEFLLGSIRFSYTPASIYLREMKANRAAFGNTNAREDSLVATIKYITMYAATQVMVTHVHTQR